MTEIKSGKLKIFATDICIGSRTHCLKEREEISDLYWFENEGVEDFDGRGLYHTYIFEIEIDGELIWRASRDAYL